jgi:small redox-active disulfide protein 2
MKTVHVLGIGCAKCLQTAENAKAAIQALSLEAQVVKVDTLPEIAKFGVLSTPALAIDGVVKAAGRVPTVDEIKGWLSA